MMLHYFLEARWSTRKTLVIFQVTRQVPLTSIYFTTFEKKRRVRSPLPHTTKLFGFWYNFTFFDYMSNKTQLFKFFHFSTSEILLSINFLGNFNLDYQNLKFFNFIYTKEHISIAT